MDVLLMSPLPALVGPIKGRSQTWEAEICSKSKFAFHARDCLRRFFFKQVVASARDGTSFARDAFNAIYGEDCPRHGKYANDLGSE